MPSLVRVTPLVLGLASMALAEAPSAADLERRRSFVPAGWDTGDCPPAYGPHAVLCGATDTGPFKVDRHIPTVWVDAPPTSCAEAEKTLLARREGKMSVARRLTGRCGPSSAPCTEIRFKDPRPIDPVFALAYLVCPTGGPVEVVQYGVSARIGDRFEPVARAQARWAPAPAK